MSSSGILQNTYPELLNTEYLFYTGLQIENRASTYVFPIHTSLQEKMEEQFIEAVQNSISCIMKIGEAIKALIGLFQITTTNHRAW